MIKNSTLSTQIHPILRWYIITSQHDSRGNLGQSEKVGYVSTIELIWLFCKHLTLFKVLTDLGVLLSIWLLTLASNWSQSLKCSTHRGNLGRSEKVGLLVNYGVNLTILCILTLYTLIWLILSLFKWFLVSHWAFDDWPKLPRGLAQIAPVSRISGAIWAVAVFALVSKPLTGKHFFLQLFI